MRGDRLKELRTRHGYTQEELAETLNIGNRQIWRYENGETEPAGDVVASIAELFNVSADYLLGLTDDPSAHLRVDNLSTKERQVLSAMRRGEVIAAIRMLISDDEVPV